MDDYLTKPFSRAELLALLRRWLPAAEAGDAAPAPALPREIAPPAALDRDVLQSLRALAPQRGDEVLANVLTTYLECAPAQVRSIAAAVAAGDVEAVSGEAHRLKSSSMSVGATRVAALARELEARAREDRLGVAASLARSLEGEWERAREALQLELEKVAS
jgi:HPt (histidine-containing phosphotransfer) domain-containing protein